MGRELQKRKNRSSIPKVRQKPKSKKKPLNNPIIAAHWNPRETLSQNYRRLGLASKLNAPTGGVAPSASALQGEEEPAKAPHHALAIPNSSDRIHPTETHVERDAAGNIVRVIEEPSRKSNPLNDPLNDLSDSEPEMLDLDDPALAPGRMGSREDAESEGEETTAVRELRDRAGQGARKAPRKPSKRECEWIERLVERYGTDHGKMMRDRKLNPMQQSEGDIKRRIAQWRQWKDNVEGVA